MRESRAAEPFVVLGEQLKVLRLKACESLAEASGAVEINTQKLLDFELGKARPSEETLLMLITHYQVADNDAAKLWDLAYGNEDGSTAQPATKDLPVLFTDSIEVLANNYGLVVNFRQTDLPSGKPETVVRLGMSREHAESVIQTLALALARSEATQATSPKLLKPGSQN